MYYPKIEDLTGQGPSATISEVINTTITSDIPHMFYPNYLEQEPELIYEDSTHSDSSEVIEDEYREDKLESMVNQYARYCR
jgi:hypothetical protein